MEQAAVNGLVTLPPAEDDLSALSAVTRRLDKAHREVQAALGKGCKAAIEAGEALIEIKRLVPHGEWMDYVADKCGIAGRTARRYCELAAQKDVLEQRLNGKMASLANLSQGEAMRMIGSLRPPKAGKVDRSARAVTLKALKAVWDRAPEDVRRQFKMVTDRAA